MALRPFAVTPEASFVSGFLAYNRLSPHLGKVLEQGIQKVSAACRIGLDFVVYLSLAKAARVFIDLNSATKAASTA